MGEQQIQKPAPNGAPAVTPPVVAPQSTALAPPAAAATIEFDPSGRAVTVGFDTVAGFEGLQRVAKAFAQSDLVPDVYRGKLANCMIAIEMATRMRASPLMVMQNLYLVHGRPAWSSQFLVASFNNCGRFSPIRYRWSGEKNKSTWTCQAWARERDTGEIVEGPEVSIGMAQAEGWKDKKGSKWLTLPQLMLTYRAATFLVRTVAPDLTMGLRTADEQEDIGAEPDAPAPPAGVAGLKAIVEAKAAEAAAQQPDPQSTPGSAPDADEQAEIAAREAEEAKAK